MLSGWVYRGRKNFETAAKTEALMNMLPYGRREDYYTYSLLYFLSSLSCAIEITRLIAVPSFFLLDKRLFV